MRSNAATPLVLALASVLAAGPALREARAAGAGVHADCGACHLGRDATPAGAATDACSRCHAGLLESELGGHAHPRSGHVGLGAALACSACHDPHDVTRAPAALTASVPAPDRLDATSRTCAGCHPGRLSTARGPGLLNHPVGIAVPAARRPGLELPLVDVRGTAATHDDVIACTTCHTVHVSANAFLLRWEPATEPAACAGCHEDLLPTVASSLWVGRKRPPTDSRTADRPPAYAPRVRGAASP